MAERTRKTPRQRAEEALGVATRKVQTLTKKRADLAKQQLAIHEELEEAKRRLEYVRKSPDLAEQTTIEDAGEQTEVPSADKSGDVPEEPPEEGQPDPDARTGEERPDFQK